tara:strand:+ start:236 stop:448 length:213 start_codon:yes stop_codon:yes gene_type:complete
VAEVTQTQSTRLLAGRVGQVEALRGTQAQEPRTPAGEAVVMTPLQMLALAARGSSYSQYLREPALHSLAV